MKTILISIILCVSLVVNAQEKISENHETKQLKCSTCHDCEIPTKQNPCITPCPRDKMAPINVQPEKAPDVLKIDDVKGDSALYKPVMFTHRLHAEMSGMAGGCRMCHHYNPPGRVISCSDCHQLNRKREDVSKPDLIGAYHRQCMDCHRSYTKTVDCVSCHEYNDVNKEFTSKKVPHDVTKRVHPDINAPERIQYETPNAPDGKIVTFYHVDHTNLFGLSCESCHSNESCNKCHAIEKSKNINKDVKEKHAICSKCHDTNSSCNFCHSNKVQAGFDHKLVTGFDLNKFHSKLQCNRCHVTNGQFTGLKNDCKSCHGEFTWENFNHKATGLILNETHSELECENCHKQPNYANPTCEDCHDDKSFPKDKPGKLVKR
jgi:hypothetical protein